MEDAATSSGHGRSRLLHPPRHSPSPPPAMGGDGLPSLLHSPEHEMPWRRTSQSPPRTCPPRSLLRPPSPPPAPAIAATPAAAACAAGFLGRLRISEKSDSFVLRQAARVGAFILGSLSIAYNLCYAYEEYRRNMDPFEGTYRVYIACLSLFLMLLEVESPKLTLLWQLLVETRGGRGLLHIFVAMTMRKLQMFGDEHIISDTMLLFGIFFVVAGTIKLCCAASQERVPVVPAVAV